MNKVHQYKNFDKYMKPKLIIEDKKINVWVKDILDFYEKSIILKNVGNVFGVDATLSAIGKKLENSEMKRLEKLYLELNNNIKQMDKEKLDYEFIFSDEFIELVFKVCNVTKREYREEKIKYYANILTNYSKVNFSEEFYKEGIIEKLEKLTVEHILILNETYKMYLRKKEKNGMPLGFFNWNELKLDKISKETIELCIVDLQINGLLYNLASFRFDGAINEEFIITPYGIKCILLIKEAL